MADPDRSTRTASRAKTLTIRVTLTLDGIRAARERLASEEQRLRLAAQSDLMELLRDAGDAEPPEDLEEFVEAAREAVARARGNDAMMLAVLDTNDQSESAP